MYKQFIKNLTVSLLSVAVISAPLSQAYAEKSDINKEIVIKAKRQASDLKNKIASYLDDVYISQGSLSIKADMVQVFSDSNNNEKVYLAKGNPAIFQQLLEDGLPIVLKAHEIRYEPALHKITVTGNASVSQEGSVVKGNKIVYNTLSEQLLAESNAQDSVTTILKPNQLKDGGNN